MTTDVITVPLQEEVLTQINQESEMEIQEDPTFSYDGFQVVRGEFFSHIYEPSITFNDYKVYVNTTCIKKLPQFNYVQILVNPDDYKLAVRPCAEEEKDSFRWCSSTDKRSPKQITCRMFFAKVISLMDWNPTYRYKLLGKLIRSNDELLFLFDLKTPEIYQRSVKNNGKYKSSRTPIFPEEWKNQFGVPVEEHRNTVSVNIFDDYAVFGLEKDTQKDKADVKPEITLSDESKGDTYEQLNLSTM